MSDHELTPQCKHLMVNLSDFIDGDLQSDLCIEIEEHLKNCNNCLVVVNTLQKTVEVYKKTHLPTGLPEGVRERLFIKLQLEEYLQNRLDSTEIT